MKRIISIILAAVLTAAIGLSFAGCKDKNDPADAITQKVADVRIGFVDCELDEELLAVWLSDRYRYESVIADGFGLGAEGAKAFYESAFFVYGVSVEIVNNTDTEIEFTGITSGTNGDGGVYIRKDFSGGAIGVDPHSSSPATIQIICTNEDATNEQVIEQVRAMSFKLTYTQGNEEKTFDSMLEDNVEVHREPAKTKEILRLGGDDVVFSEALWEQYKDGTDSNKAALKNGFGVSDDFIDKFYKKSEDYNFFNCVMRIQNMTEKDITVLDITTPENGKNGIYVNIARGSEMGIPAYDPNADYPLPAFAIQVLSTDLNLEEGDIQNTIYEMKFTVTYAEMTADGEPDYNNKQTVTVTIG